MSDSDIKEKIIQVVPLENAVIRLLTKAHLAFLEGEHTPTTNGNSADWQKISPSYYEDTHPKEITFLCVFQAPMSLTLGNSGILIQRGALASVKKDRTVEYPTASSGRKYFTLQ